MTRFFITFGMEQHLPSLPTPKTSHKFYGESSTNDIICKLLIMRDVARSNNEDTTDIPHANFGKTAQLHKFLPQQLVPSLLQNGQVLIEFCI
jgi:hypothetical protein